MSLKTFRLTFFLIFIVPNVLNSQSSSVTSDEKPSIVFDLIYSQFLVLSVPGSDNKQVIKAIFEMGSQKFQTVSRRQDIKTFEIQNKTNSEFKVKCQNHYPACVESITDLNDGFRIYYDENYFSNLYLTLSSNDAEKKKIFSILISTLVHEIAHHILDHTSNNHSSNYSTKFLELEADWIAGYYMKKMGLSEEESQSAVKNILKENDSDLKDRLEAIQSGWSDADSPRLELSEDSKAIKTYLAFKSSGIFGLTQEIPKEIKESKYIAKIKFDYFPTEEYLVDRKYRIKAVNVDGKIDVEPIGRIYEKSLTDKTITIIHNLKHVDACSDVVISRSTNLIKISKERCDLGWTEKIKNLLRGLPNIDFSLTSIKIGFWNITADKLPALPKL